MYKLKENSSEIILRLNFEAQNMNRAKLSYLIKQFFIGFNSSSSHGHGNLI